MPGLIAFGRRWKRASDEFVFSGMTEIVQRTIWLFVLLVIWVSDSPGIGTYEGNLIEVYFAVASIISGLTIFFTVLLVKNSMKGTIMDASQRRNVPLLIYIRLGLGIPELIWTVVGTAWAFSLTEWDRIGSSITALRAFVIFKWLMLVLVVIRIAAVFEVSAPVSSMPVTAGASDTAYQRQSRLWELRCKLLCCFCCSGKGRTRPAKKEAFREIADLLANLFHGVDLVTSDIVAGLVLLNQRFRLQSERVQPGTSLINHNARLAGSSSSDSLRSGDFGIDIEAELDFPPVTQSVVECSIARQHWMTPSLAHWYLKYARGIYGWKLHVYTEHCKGLSNIVTDARCCLCCSNQLPYDVLDDTCCGSNLAALKRIAYLAEADIVYASFHNKLYEVPFCVAADHHTKSVVVAIRGTLSFQDALTDLTAKPEAIDAEGLPPGFLAHKGMLNASLYVRNQLEQRNILETAFQRYPSFQLVVVGHSLGAGTAALVSTLLIPKYPDLKCFAYSPPGGLLNEEAARFTESFTLSIVTGDDLVSRLSLKNMDVLKRRLLAELRACKHPKYRVLLKGCWSAFFTKASTTMIDNPTETEATTVDEDTLVDPNHVPLYLPGKILHVTEKEADELYDTPRYDWTWRNRQHFEEILVTKTMLSHHLPDYVDRVLRGLDEQILQSS